MENGVAEFKVISAPQVEGTKENSDYFATVK
jgi:hypothetical protein